MACECTAASPAVTRADRAPHYIIPSQAPRRSRLGSHSPTYPMATMTVDSLEEGSRSLQLLISSANDLPNVSRSIHQIAEQSERMLAGSGPAATSAATHRFLSQAGVDVMELDPSVLELARPVGLGAATTTSTVGTDLESYIANEEQQLVQETILEANELVAHDFEIGFWQRDHANWEVCAAPRWHSPASLCVLGSPAHTHAFYYLRRRPGRPPPRHRRRA